MKTASGSKIQEAYNKIKELILDQQLFPGQKLIYRDLEEKLGMTKTPIITALTILEKEGFVLSKKNRGFYISEIDIDEAVQIFDLRQKLEEITVEYTITNFSRDDLSILKEKLKQYLKYESPVYDKKRRTLDTEFHLQIAKMGENPFLYRIMKQFYENVYFNLKVIYLTPCVETFKKEHAMLFEAIRKKNLLEAKEILRNHNRAAKDVLIKYGKS